MMKSGSVVAQRLKEARVKAGISQKRLGILAGIDEVSETAPINQHERRKHSPEFSTVERMAKILGIPTPFFYSRDENLAKWILRYSKKAASRGIKRDTKHGSSNSEQ